MKPAVSVTLIICGTLLILAPWLFQYLQLRELTELAAALKWDQLNYDSSRQQEDYAFFCWISGAAMVLLGVFGPKFYRS